MLKYHLGSHSRLISTGDIVVVNPAVPLDNKFVQLAREWEKSYIASRIIFQFWR
jgi:UDP-N-acetylmuramoylalanine-D-glutamate ligase